MSSCILLLLTYISLFWGVASFISVSPCHFKPEKLQKSALFSLPKDPSSEIERAHETFNNNIRLLSSFIAVAVTPTVVDAYGAVEVPTVKKAGKVKVLETSLGIKYIDLKVGEGSTPGDGDIIAINYIGFLKNGQEFDSQYAKKALSFKYGAKQIIPGIEDVLETMRPGGQRSCTIPGKKRS